ncbi:MAG: DUF924 domain-containing protein [Gammaproteobacteria bacterium]|nr:DUF924 domain-containing protein [Gammaproteobacteria bacterium]MCP5199786.1 DUF924 domain-containing protein [Gammaproteobacteria bacterium]
MQVTPAQVLDFYFGTRLDDVAAMRACLDRWFTVDRAFDAAIDAQFGDAVRHALDGGYPEWVDEARPALALVVLLDQLPRNIFRGSGRAFAGDARARTVALQAFEQGHDQVLSLTERIILHMPLEHAEDLALQDRCVAGYEALHAAADPAWHPITSAALKAGYDHRAVIRRFGRFPHRNLLLGRACTAEETAYLAENRSAWGQGAADLEDA